MEIEDAIILSYTENPKPEPKPKVYDFTKDEDVILYLLDNAFIELNDKVYMSCSNRREDGTFDMRILSSNVSEDYKIRFNNETQQIEKELYVNRTEDTVEAPIEDRSEPSNSGIHSES